MFGISLKSKRLVSSRAVGPRGGIQHRSLRLAVEMLEPRCLLSGAPVDLMPHDVTVMSQNLFLGADQGPVFAAVATGDPTAVIGAATQFWAGVYATNFPERAQAIAKQIKANRPDLIGLQEVTQFKIGEPYSLFPPAAPNPATEITLDYLDILQDALHREGLNYRAVATTTEAQVELPTFYNFSPTSGQLQNVRMIDRDVILVSNSIPQSQLANIQQEQHFADDHILHFDIGGQVIDVYRGWQSVDVTLPNRRLRFINTHLETVDNPDPSIQPQLELLQQAQAFELLTGPAATEMSVIMVGDFNARAPSSLTYQLLVGATPVPGLVDAWAVTHPGDQSPTWGNDPNLLNPEPLILDPQRIDFVLYRGTMTAESMTRIGVSPSDRTPSGLWPSDHAGVVATLAVTSAPMLHPSVAAQAKLPREFVSAKPVANPRRETVSSGLGEVSRSSASATTAALSRQTQNNGERGFLSGQRRSRVVGAVRTAVRALAADRVLAAASREEWIDFGNTVGGLDR